MQISGVIGKPEIARSNRANQLFFVNKRHIKDKTLTAATEQAFKGLIPIGKFGFVILNITMNPSKVDVNVHPAKLEVRFEAENKIFQSIYHAIKDTLLKSELVANTEEQEIEQNNSKGLFEYRKNETQKIESYNDEESKIKTNVVTNIENKMNFGQGGPINTADILEQLKKMKEDLQTQVEEQKEEIIESKSESEIESKIEIEEQAVEENNNEIIQEDEYIIEEIQNEESINENNEEQELNKELRMLYKTAKEIKEKLKTYPKTKNA